MTTPSSANDPRSKPTALGAWLDGGGETGELIRCFDWSRTAIGLPHAWPQSLQTAVTLMLHSRQPTSVAWGPSLVSMYNDGYIPLCGARHPGGIGQPFSELWREVWPDVQPHVQATLGGNAQWVENKEVALAGRGAGGASYFSFSYTPLRDDDGHVAGFFCAAVETTQTVLAARQLAVERAGIVVDGFDATGRAQADAALRDSEARLRALNDALERRVVDLLHERGRTWQVTPDMLGVMNADARFEKTNPAWQTALGWSEDEIARTPFFDFLHPDDQAHTRAAHAALQRGEPVLRFVNRCRHKDGSYRWLSWVAVHEGSKLYCSARDVTAEKAREAELATRTAELDRVWRHSRDLLVVVGADGVFRAANPAWTAILGYAPSELVGRSFRDFIWPEDATHTQGGLDTAAVANLTGFENRYRHKDGTLRWMSWHTTAEGDVVYAYGRDITEHKRAQAELNAVQDALRHSQRMEAVGQLTGGVAHDFNNILQVIATNLYLAGRYAGTSPPAEKVQQRLAVAQGAVKRGAKLAEQLLAFGRRQALEPRIIHLGRLAVGIEDMLRRSIGEAVEVETVVSGGLWNTLADPAQVENALLNLAINSRDAMGGNGKLTIEVGNAYLDDDYAARHPDVKPGQYVLLCVSDTGAGMTPEVIDQAFEPFFSTKPAGSGTGLGLSMVYGFVKQSGGHVKIYSEVGHGSTVKLYLPRATGEADPLEPLEPSAQVGGGTETVLVVEDDDAVRNSTVEVLGNMGYRVLKAADAASALTVIDSGVTIDLLFTDVVMPGPLRSPELARKARERLPGIAVLFTSGYAKNAIVHGGRLDNGVELLAKPYSQEALAHRVRSVLRMRAMQNATAPSSATAPTNRPDTGVKMKKLTVLLVEDDEQVRTSTAELIEDLGYTVLQSPNAEAAMQRLRDLPVDVLVTDVGLPGRSGDVFAAEARGVQPDIRLVFATGRDTIPDLNGDGNTPVLLRKPFDIHAIEAALKAATASIAP